MPIKSKPLYIETFIECPLEVIWDHTQKPEIHEQWDLRFTEIKYLPKASESDPQQFLYTTQIGFGLKVAGNGESVGTKSKSNGESTSVLKFWSAMPVSIISEGSGYWKYIPVNGGIKFLTGYDYKVRWGFTGKLIDKFIFRPLIGWATAWSFDALKLWIEKNIHPKNSIQKLKTILIANITLAFIWIYMGLIPKILFTDTGELDMIKNIKLFNGVELLMVNITGVIEIVFGIMFLFRGQKKWMHWVNMGALFLLTTLGLFGNPQAALAPFNPVTITLAMIALSIVVLINLPNLPSAKNCIRKAPKN